MSKLVNVRDDIPTVAVRPTKKNPDISVVIGDLGGGNYTPKGFIYPDYLSDAEIDTKVKDYHTNYAADKPCNVCNRYASEQTLFKGVVAIGIVSVLAVVIAMVLYSHRAKETKQT